MGRVYKPHRLVNGVRVLYTDWYCQWHGADGKTKRKKIGPDKRLATEALARFEARERRKRLGLSDSTDDEASRLVAPIAEIIVEYLSVLAGRDASPGYRNLADNYLTRLATDCGWFTFRDVSADSLTVYLGRRRTEHGNGPATLNSYIRVAKGFTNWYADKIDVKRPLAKLKPFPEEVDRRRSRRLLSDVEFGQLLGATAACPRKGRRGIRGPDRVMLYLVAAYSGIRAGELATLTPESFSLDTIPPTVTVAAHQSKGKREEPIPLPAHVVERLKPWLVAKPARERLWPGRWAEQRKQREWLARDLARAGVTEFDAKGQRVTFHSLKRRYITRLIQSGANVDEVRRLGRHRDLRTTMQHYAESNLIDLAKAVERLPQTT